MPPYTWALANICRFVGKSYTRKLIIVRVVSSDDLNPHWRNIYRVLLIATRQILIKRFIYLMF